MDNEEEELGIRCIAAPIFSGPAVIAAVSVTGTTLQIEPDDVDRVVTSVKRAAARISAASVEAGLQLRAR
jgi:DNA-binding IclR family transcriptional regulator